MKKSLLVKLLSAVLCAAALAGCSGGSKYAAATAGEYMVAAETTAAAYDSYAPAPAGAAYDYEGSYNDAGIEYGAESAAEEEGAGLTGSGPITPASPVGRKLIRSVLMNVETDAFDQVVKQLQEKVAELSGYIEQSDISGASMERNYGRHASITARIPSTNLDQFIAVVEGSGNVTYKSESTQDVTLQYSDLESRKKTLSVEQDRIWALLEKADTLEAVIALEERLSEIRYELESMESRLKLYDNQVEYSTININVNEKTVIEFTPTAPETVGQRIQKGFTKNVNGVIETLTDLFVFLVTASPVWIPFGILIAVVVILARRTAKKRLKETALSQLASQQLEEMKPKE